MEIKLKRGGEGLDPISRVLYLRGTDWSFLEPKESDQCDYNSLDNIEAAARRLLKALVYQEQVYVQVDSDCDGYTSAALLINYLHKLYPSWIENKVKWFMHDGKQHGLSDCIDFAIERQYQLVICPDASSNDYSEHRKLSNAGIQ
jgi:single-stranded-DNA-specific exonuclease